MARRSAAVSSQGICILCLLFLGLLAFPFLKLTPPIVLLDEVTASLDPENEVLIQQTISALVAEKTVVVIAHRLQSVCNADQIIVLESGAIKESGSHDTLLE